VEAGKFREDLYFRLNVVNIHMPPLRVRPEDIPILANAFLRELSKENRRDTREISQDAMDAMLAYRWPGNVRELRTAIEHGVVMSSGTKLLLRHLPASLRGGPVLTLASSRTPAALPAPGTTTAPQAPATQPPPDLNLAAMEDTFIREALRRSGENRSAAAKMLGISRRTLHRKLHTMGLVESPDDADS
jgi:DNA-binding NtrC family response regulator